MYTQDVNKQQTILAGVIGSLICEIESGDYKTIKAFQKELQDIDSIREFATGSYQTLMQCKTLEDAKQVLIDTQNSVEYKLVKTLLESKGVSCCGYTDQGRQICVYNDLAQLTIDCDKPTGPQLDNFINKWL
ncbi:hypothetical protein VPIG_00071 [Vibrio phage PWH3a-P1]|uniref:hypothetical protein n=1 Tax=Vibrio phage PWH3a-P1 TaxID=754058 RepID=UPI0002C08C85|nr:hypothetical protein VPIG_00071 [Vibrio phage PWH3a-P1]AGH31929.1 hypothetical protein VPIG_00071 [Vibrio phage PWH3a-P1]